MSLTYSFCEMQDLKGIHELVDKRLKASEWILEIGAYFLGFDLIIEGCL